MGTRNVTVVKLNGETKVAQYCQWDGYPTGQGIGIAQFVQGRLLTPEGLNAFKEAISGLSWVTNESLKAKWVECGASPDSDYVDMKTSDKFQKRFPEFHRDTGSKILALIADGKVKELRSDEDYAVKSEGFGCEYVYVLDLDAESVTVYGGNLQPDCKLKTYALEDFTVEAMKSLDEELSEE